MSKKELHYYAIIPSKILIDKNITPNAKLLYGIISSLTNISGRCFASDKYFAEIFSVSKVSIQNWLKELENAGYISRNVFYKEDSKEIDHRDIILNGLVGSQGNKNTCIQENLYTGIQENLVDNIKDLNSISLSKDKGESKDSPNNKSNNKSNISFNKDNNTIENNLNYSRKLRHIF